MVKILTDIDLVEANYRRTIHASHMINTDAWPAQCYNELSLKRCLPGIFLATGNQFSASLRMLEMKIYKDKNKAFSFREIQAA